MALCGRTSGSMKKKIIIALSFCAVLSQCNTLRSDCEALAEREATIATEEQGEYFVGRRYYIPLCRFWGYLREPGQSWRTARLVPLFRAESYEVRSSKPGFLFVPSEKYSKDFVTLRPEVMPAPEVCTQVLSEQ